jgi:hypothetical protein
MSDFFNKALKASTKFLQNCHPLHTGGLGMEKTCKSHNLIILVNLKIIWFCWGLAQGSTLNGGIEFGFTWCTVLATNAWHNTC